MSGARSPRGFKSTVISVFGAPGTGKTSLIIALVRERGVLRYLAIDPYASIPAQRYGTLDAIHRRMGQLARSSADEFRISFVKGIDDQERGPVNPAQYLARWALSESAVLIVDEAHEYCGQHDPKRAIENHGAPALLVIARQGRHHGCGIWVCSQRPAAVSRDLTANSERFFFRIDEPADLKYARDVLGRRIADVIASLEDLTYVYRLGHSAHLGKITWKNNLPSMEIVRDLTDLLPRATGED